MDQTPNPVSSQAVSPEAPREQNLPWFRRLSRPILFLTISMALIGGYLALTIPVSVFPKTDFPRIVIGVDNGVMPIDQMLVTITRPMEEAVNSVPGLQKVWSTTSRGSAEVDAGYRGEAEHRAGQDGRQEPLVGRVPRRRPNPGADSLASRVTN